MEVYVAGKGIERPLRVGIALEASQDRGASETNKKKPSSRQFKKYDFIYVKRNPQNRTIYVWMYL